MQTTTQTTKQELIARLQTDIWADFDSENSFPAVRPLLAHYTSIAVFEQMMANDEVWFSNPLYMNDLEELRFGMIEGARAFRESTTLREAIHSQDVHARLVFFFDHLFNEFDTKHAFQTYIMCLSLHSPEDTDGRLSMWRGYGAGGNGVAIVFNTAEFEANEASPLIVGPVKYGTSTERLAWINEKVNALAEILEGQDLDDETLFQAAYHWIERLKLFSLFTKHNGFCEENEWRVVYMNERDPNGALSQMHSYAITARGAEPKLKLKVRPLEGVFNENLEFDKIVDRIILGPTTSTVLAANTVKRILVQKGKGALAQKIVPSTIPFRP